MFVVIPAGASTGASTSASTGASTGASASLGRERIFPTGLTHDSTGLLYERDDSTSFSCERDPWAGLIVNQKTPDGITRLIAGPEWRRFKPASESDRHGPCLTGPLSSDLTGPSLAAKHPADDIHDVVGILADPECPADKKTFLGPLPELGAGEQPPGPVARYSVIEASLKALVASLTEQKDVWRVVFGCGTVVEAATGAGPKFGGFTAENSRIPVSHFMDEELVAKLHLGNRYAWEGLKKVPGAAGEMARGALAVLVADGFPHQGFDGETRTVRKMEGYWRVDWKFRDKRIYNIRAILNGDIATAVSDKTARARRFDCMTPRVRAVVAPDLAITRL